MTEVIIFDIDGTLADVEHRRVHMRGEKPDWKRWNADMHLDTPNWPVVDMLERYSWDYPIFIFSGRMESDSEGDWRAVTEKWLEEKADLREGFEYQRLMMRKPGDYRSDVIVKREMLHEIQAEGYEVKFTVDDRQSVVDMWQEEGLTCFQVAPGDFDTVKEDKYEPGKLVLLVGPSGAGKSTWINNGQQPGDAVVSSDGLRKQLCGDFKDQTKNQQVFAALHAIVKARITHGLDVVVDATNLRNRDRRTLRDLCPDNTVIQYIIIDRPLEEKINDGGWRNDVMINGQTLIERHDEIFQANLKDIKNGDGDPRVFVTDLRNVLHGRT